MDKVTVNGVDYFKKDNSSIGDGYGYGYGDGDGYGYGY